jgi:photosynthetic reaction center H subunit
MRGAISEYVDFAQLVLYAFWIFFIGLIIYLRREDKREGYPLDNDRANERVKIQGFPAMPEPKTFNLAHGGTYQAPHPEIDGRELKAWPNEAWPGSPLNPTGNPMLDGVGPAAYALRANAPELDAEGHARIAPMRHLPEFTIESRDPDPRGMLVIAGDGATAGIVTDVWVDRSEPQIRFLEVEVPAGAGKRNVLLPIGFLKFDALRKQVRVRSILASQFADVPGFAADNQLTLREEDQITAYYAGGTLYATPARLGPLL